MRWWLQIRVKPERYSRGIGLWWGAPQNSGEEGAAEEEDTLLKSLLVLGSWSIFFFKFSPGGPTCLSTTSTWAEKDSCLDQSQYSKARLLSKPEAAALAHKVAGSWASQRQGSPPLPSSPRYFDFFFHSTQTSRLQATGWTCYLVSFRNLQVLRFPEQKMAKFHPNCL